jgi:CBS domain-containing protein
MIREEILGALRVRNVRELIVSKPTTIGPDESIIALLTAINDDKRTRHVYVVDEQNRLLGSVRMLSVVEYLFPFSAALERGGGLIGCSVDWTDKMVRDLLNYHPFMVNEVDQLVDAARIMMREKITELPVIDTDGRVIGQINMYEIIEAFLQGMGQE